MFKLIKVALLFLLISPVTYGASSGGGIGINAGFGVPFVTQYGLNYQMSDSLGFSATYNNLSLDVGISSVKLTMPEVLVHYHPFSGSFFLAAGIGKESLEVTSTDTTTSLTAGAKIDANTVVAKTGWMWGLSNGGFWFGMDVSYIMPSGAETTITNPGVPTTSQAYLDLVDASNKFGETSYVNVTFAKLGYIF